MRILMIGRLGRATHPPSLEPRSLPGPTPTAFGLSPDRR
jgi:hypothetical protein